MLKNHRKKTLSFFTLLLHLHSANAFRKKREGTKETKISK